MSRDGDDDRSGPGWPVTLLGASVLLLVGFALGVVVGAVREEPELILNHLAGGTQSVAPASPSDASHAPVSVPAGTPDPAASTSPVPSAPESRAPTVTPGVTARANATDRPTPAEPAAEPPLDRGREVPSPPVASPPPATGGRFFIQVGAFAESAQAEKLASELRKKGFAVAIAPGTGDRASRWRVRVGPLGSRADADRAAERLRSREKLPTWTLDESR